jgi:hypothetical protein
MTPTASPTTGSTAFEGHAARHNTTRFARVRHVTREPFFHFALLGALVFGGHRLIVRMQSDAPTIEVSRSKQRELSNLFEQRQRRAPNQTEREQLVQRHLEDEVLLREGLRLSLVQTDPNLRAQVIARVRGMLQSELEQKPPTDSQLQRHYQEHLAEFSVPETVSYREYWIHRGPDSGRDARQLMAALRAGKSPAEGLPTPSDSAHSEAQLISMYDQEVARSLWTLPNDNWHELRSERGIHIVRVHEHTPASRPPFADVREQVSTSYRKDQIDRAFQAELARLMSHWGVVVEEGP